MFCSRMSRIGWVGKGAKALRILFVLGEKLHELAGVFVRRRREEHRVDQAEDGGVHADPEREHGDGGEGEARRFPELANGETEVLDHIVLFLLFCPKSDHGVDFGGPARRDEAGDE